MGTTGKRSRSATIANDIFNLSGSITQLSQSRRNRSVNDLEVTATSEFLELHEREIWFNPCSVAIHHQRDRSRRSNNSHLGVSIAECLAEFEHPIGFAFGGIDEIRMGIF